MTLYQSVGQPNRGKGVGSTESSGEINGFGGSKTGQVCEAHGAYLVGHAARLTRYHIILKIAGEIVLVYRHGLLSFSVEAPAAEE